jgi:hypothetical protein
MFDGCKGLTTLEFSSNFEKIGEYSFANCTNLANLVIDSSSLKVIDSYAFQNCTKLASFTLPSSLYEIDGAYVGEGIVNGCESLNTLTIPYVGKTAYSTATKFQETLFGWVFGTVNPNKPDKFTATTSNYLNASNVGTGYTFYVPMTLTAIIIQAETSIQYGAFQNVPYVKSITIPQTVTSIGAYAFYNMNNLTRLDIPSSVTSIGDYAAAECDALEETYIYSQIIGNLMYYNCNSLTLVDAMYVTSIPKQAFALCEEYSDYLLNKKSEQNG